MAIFTAWAKKYSVKYFCNTRVGGLGKILSSKKISAVQQSVAKIHVCGHQKQFQMLLSWGSITYKYKKQLNKLKKLVGMAGPKSTQTRVVGIITDEMHPYI